MVINFSQGWALRSPWTGYKEFLTRTDGVFAHWDESRDIAAPYGRCGGWHLPYQAHLHLRGEGHNRKLHDFLYNYVFDSRDNIGYETIIPGMWILLMELLRKIEKGGRM